MKISIIIPVYNVSNYIERCLLSALNQSYQNTEIILVDDASPDDSILKVRKILEENSIPHKVKIITHTTNKGLSAARNTGVKNSSGEYLFFMDSDDEIPVNSIKTLTKYVIDNPKIDCVVGNIEIINSDNPFTPSLKTKNNILYGSEIIDSYLKKEWYEMAWNKLVKRKLFFEDNCWFKEGIVHEDNLWSFILAYKSQIMVICEEQTYLYYIQDNSITQKKNDRNFNSLYKVLEEILLFIPSKDYGNRKNLLCTYLTDMKIYLFKSLLLNNCRKEYIREIETKVNVLFLHPLFINWNKPYKLIIKESFLKIWMSFYYYFHKTKS